MQRLACRWTCAVVLVAGLIVSVARPVAGSGGPFSVMDTGDPLVAAFAANVQQGLAPLVVQFTDMSEGNPTGWAWYFGDENCAGGWTQVTGDADWPVREAHSSVVLPNGDLLVMGGLLEIGFAKDAWRSSDGGGTWLLMTGDAPWGLRYEHSSVALPDGKVLVMGGDGPTGRKNDVWQSADGGSTWTQLTGSAAWEARFNQACAVLPDGSIVLTGGQTGIVQNDVWRSTDGGASWTHMTNNAPWAARRAHESVALPDGSIVVMGGLLAGAALANDVWRSTDGGASWTQMTAGAPWSARRDFGSVVLPDGSIVILGGVKVVGFDTIPLDDAWRSTDQGATWTRIREHAEWAPRSGLTAGVLVDGGIVVMGGSGDLGMRVNDVWRLHTAGSYEQHPLHTYAFEGAYHVALRVYDGLRVHDLVRPDYIVVTNAPLVVDFTANPREGLAPLDVQFTDQSEGDPTAWAWYFGDEALSGAWQQVTAAAPWEGRDKYAAAVLPDGDIIVAGGYVNVVPYYGINDVWRSADGGASWIQMRANAEWSSRIGHACVALPDGGLVLMGGTAINNQNDVWHSADKGASWTRMTDNAGWSARAYFAVEALPDGSIVLMGGHTGQVQLNDVWRSTDNGATWIALTAAAPWRPRAGHSSTVEPNGDLLLMGGHMSGPPWHAHDVWRSSDGGATWGLVTDAAPWSARASHQSLSLPDGSAVLLGGNDGALRNDVWRSTDGGANWVQVTAAAEWSARMQFFAGVLPDGAMVIMGGNVGTQNMGRDVWRLDTAGSVAQHPVHRYERNGQFAVTLQAYNAGGADRKTQAAFIRVGRIPSGGETLADRRPVFAWPTVVGATWYQVWLNRDGWHQASRWVEGANQWTPSADLPGGEYAWWVRSWSSESGYGAWSEAALFRISYAVPGRPAVLGPAGVQAVGERQPLFTWSASDPGASWYRIWINRDGQAHLTQWVEAQTDWMPAEALPAGTYNWWVQGWNVDGVGAWSEKATFAIPAMQPGAITQLQPTGAALGRHVTYSWQKDARATWYRLWVGGSGTLLDRWFAGAGEGDAIADPGPAGPVVAKPVPAAPVGEIAENQPRFHWFGGEYRWWIRGWGPDGYGPWSGPMAFSMPYAEGTWTRVVVNRENANVIDVWTQDGELFSPPLASGSHSWWLGVWEAATGRTIWSDRMDFAVP